MRIKEIIIYGFLTQEEVLKIKGLLDNIEIESHIRQTPDDRNEAYYQISIKKSDLEKAKPALFLFEESQKKKLLKMKSMCPKCGAKPPFVKEKQKMSFWKWIYTIGTKVMVCRKCRHEWYV